MKNRVTSVNVNLRFSKGKDINSLDGDFPGHPGNIQDATPPKL